MAGLFDWFRRPTPVERLESYRLRPDLLEAATVMASDERSDPYIARLQASLTDSERVLRLMDGRHSGEMGLLVLTSERVFFRARRSQGPLAFDIALGAITGFEAETRRGVGRVSVRTMDRSLLVDQILGTQGEQLADEARSALSGPASAAHRDPMQLLAELRALRDSGAITVSEFEIRKAALWKEL